MNLFTVLADELRGEGRFMGACRSAEFIFIPVLAIGLILLLFPETYQTSFALRDLATSTGRTFKALYALIWVLAGALGSVGTTMGVARAYAPCPRRVNVVERWSRIISATMSCLLFSWLTFKFYIASPTLLPTLPLYIYAVTLSTWNAMLAWNNR